MTHYNLTKFAENRHRDRIDKMDYIASQLRADELRRNRDTATILGGALGSMGTIALHSLAEKKLPSLKDKRKFTFPIAGLTGLIAGGKIGSHLHDKNKDK